MLLDIDPSLSTHRISHRGEGTNDFERIENLKKTREIFSSIRDKYIIKIDGSMSIEAVSWEVLMRFIDGPLKARRCAKDYGCEDPFHCSFRLSNTCEWVRLAARLRPPVRESAAL